MAGVESLVALKMHTGLTLGDFARFTERARALTEIDHPHVMHLVDAFVGTALIDDDVPPDDAFGVLYTAADWIPGLSLPAALEASDKTSGLHWVAQVARAAGYLHAFRSPDAPAGVVHRDIKPSNVRITPDEGAVLIDFGIARPHEEGDHTEGAGTYLWRAPEVLGGPGDPGPASDAWGVGALAYWVLLAEPPRLEGAAAARELLTPAARNAGVVDPRGVGRHISELLETHPQRRPGDLSHWADDMDRRAAGRRPRRRPRLAAIAAVILVLAGGVTAAAVSQGGAAAPSTSQSRTLAHDAVQVLPSDVGLGSLLSLASYARAPTSSARAALVDALEQPLDAVLHDGSPVVGVAYDARGTLLATGDSAGHVVVWDTATATPIHRFEVGSPVTGVALSPDGRLVVIGDAAGDVVAWRIGRASSTRSTFRVGREVTSVAVSPDGADVAVGDVRLPVGDRGADVIVWHLATGRKTVKRVPLGSSVTSVAFDPTGAPLLAIGARNGDVDLWQIDAVKVVRLWLPDDAPVSSVSFSADGATVAAGYGSDRVELWNALHPIADSSPEAILPTDHPVTGVSFSADTLAVGDSAGDITLWDATSHAMIGHPWASGGPVTGVALDAGATTVATGARSGDVMLWSTAPRRATLTPAGGPSPIDSVAFSRAGQLLAAANYAGDVSLWNVASDKEVALLPGDGSQVDSVALDDDGLLLATGDKLGNVALWNTLTDRELWVRNDGSRVYDVAFSPDGKEVAAGDAVPQTILWSVAHGTEVGRPLRDPAGSSVRSVTFSPDGEILATGDDGGFVTRWRTDTLTQMGRPLLVAKGRIVRSVAFSPDGSVLAAGGDGGSTTLWDMPSGIAVRRLPDHGAVLSMAFVDGGRTLVTGDADGLLRAWVVATGNEAGPPWADGGQVFGLGSSADGSLLAAANDGSTVAVVPTLAVSESTGQLVTSLCAEIRGNLSPRQWTTHVGAGVPYQTVCPGY